MICLFNFLKINGNLLDRNLNIDYDQLLAVFELLDEIPLNVKVSLNERERKKQLCQVNKSNEHTE